jgi:hypothetical protein
MLISGILNPQLSHLLCRVRHTNALVIAETVAVKAPDVIGALGGFAATPVFYLSA